MSAESPRRGSRGTGAVVRPQPVSDKTVVESVVNFFSDVALTSGTPKAEDKEKVQWVRFEQADVNDVNCNPDCNPRSGIVAPLVIVLGYTNGVHVWIVPTSGEAQEVLSLRQGPVRIFRLLPNPIQVFDRQDVHATKRPLVAICDASSAGQPYCCVKFVSLRTGDEVHNIAFSHPITDIQTNNRVVVIAFPEKVAVFDACQFKQLFWITTCYPCPSHNPNPISLGSRWLAYADSRLVPVHQSCGGMSGDGGQSYAATVISAAKTLTKGLSMFSETVASSLTGAKTPHTPPKKDPISQDSNRNKPGVVTVVDVQTVGTGQVAVLEDSECEGFVAHFPAHATESVSAMKFDPSGSILLTVDRLGHNFHLFRIMAHPTSCSLGAVHHLYTLHRGDTTAKVQDIAFTLDSRWVAISTVRGTTHIFPITPYGGTVNVRTHMSQRMVNRASRFHRSAGLDDFDNIPSGRDSPAPGNASPGSSPGRHDHYRHHTSNTINNNFGNPRLPPFPHPTTVSPVVQIKHGLNFPGLGGSTPSSKGKGKPHTSTAVLSDIICVAACFAPSRGWVAGSPTLSREKSDEKRPVDSLFIINWMGNLIEYILDPRAKPSTEKVTDESPLEVLQCPRAQWTLVRNTTASELRAPLPSNNPLTIACDAVVTQKPSGELGMSQGMGMRQESKESLSSDHSLKDELEEQWLSQVEIITHAGPHRRLWMGPQFTFKTFQGTGTTTILPSNPSVLLSHSPEGGSQGVSTLDIVGEDVDLQSLKINPSRSSPVSMPGSKRNHRLSSGSDTHNPSPLGTFIEAVLTPTDLEIEQRPNPIYYSTPGSYEQSPSVLEGNMGWPEAAGPVQSGGIPEDLLRESLADAMTEAPVREHRHTACRDLDGGSLENLSTSSGSACSATRGQSFDARSSPPHSIEHVLVFPSSGGGGSPDSN